tara:strand:- start:289 stop:639 length:351 start_codon:yes stop_codon:yes gene_type:complete
MHDTEKTVARALKWLEMAEDEEEIEDVQRLIERIARQPDSTRVAVWVEALSQFIKGTRLTVTLNEAQLTQKATVTQSLLQIFAVLPNLSIPRNKTVEALAEKVELAIKENMKAESK